MKSGFVTLVGRSNVGKSTLLNALVGTKVAITSRKPQTTRFAVHGIVHDPRGQIVFVDTPGIFEKPHNVLTRTLNDRAKEATRDIDAIVYVTDPTRPIGNEENIVLRILAPITAPKILVINKIDVRNPAYIEEYRALSDRFIATIEVSALKRHNLDAVKDAVIKVLPEGEPFYEEFRLTNLETKEWVSEIIREKIFIQMGAELPYSISVEVDEIEEREDKKHNKIIFIKANILTTNNRHKQIIIGRDGRKIKEIGSASRKELEAVLGQHIFLELEVVHDEHWPDRLP